LDTDERKIEFEYLTKVYEKIKNSDFLKGLNRYRFLKILINNNILPKKRRLGNKPKSITKIRIEGLCQVDVKVTHIGDLKYHAVGY
jgi:hypothetical protein